MNMGFLWIYSINIILIIVVVCFQKKEPIVAMAWVLCFIALPVVGAVIYIVFGVGLKNRTKKKYLEKTNASLSFFTGLKSQKIPEKYAHMVNYFKNTSHSVLTDNNSVEIFTDARDKYEALLKDIEGAKETVNLLYFIVRDDKIGTRLIKLLEKKADEGVQIRFLYDGFGSLLTQEKRSCCGILPTYDFFLFADKPQEPQKTCNNRRKNRISWRNEYRG